jgi:hypothetical protein
MAQSERSRCEIYENEDGIYIATPAYNVHINGNQIYGNTNINSGLHVENAATGLDAVGNWWGDASGPDVTKDEDLVTGSGGGENSETIYGLSTYGTTDLPLLKFPTSETSEIIISKYQLDESLIEIQLFQEKKPKTKNILHITRQITHIPYGRQYNRC